MRHAQGPWQASEVAGIGGGAPEGGGLLGKCSQGVRWKVTAEEGASRRRDLSHGPPSPLSSLVLGILRKLIQGPPQLLLPSCPPPPRHHSCPQGALGPGTVPFEFLLLPPPTSNPTNLVHLTFRAAGN